MEVNAKTNKSKIYVLAMTAVMAALIAAISPFAIPIGPISITLCTLALYFSPYILGWKGASVATLVYIMLGMVGMPVFSKFQAGLGVLMGPTGGYILGYVPMVVLAGLAIKLAPQNRVLQFLGMIGATAVLYAFGTAWYMCDTLHSPGPGQDCRRHGCGSSPSGTAGQGRFPSGRMSCSVPCAPAVPDLFRGGGIFSCFPGKWAI